MIDGTKFHHVFRRQDNGDEVVQVACTEKEALRKLRKMYPNVRFRYCGVQE